MTSEEVIVAVIDALWAVDVQFMVVGSVATNFYGIPRSTRDADFAIQIPPPFAVLTERLGTNLRATLHNEVSCDRVAVDLRGTEQRDGRYSSDAGGGGRSHRNGQDPH